MTPQKHGINNFISISEETYEQQLVTSDDRRVKALWNVLSEADMKVGLFSYWASWPPEPINGYNVTERALFDPERGVFPDELRTLITLNSARELGLQSILGDMKVGFPEPDNPNDPNFFSLAHNQVDTLRKLFISNSLFLYKRELPDALIQISGVIDAAQHLFLKFAWSDQFPGEIDPELLAKYEGFLEELYIAHDAMIGEYIKLAGPNTHIIIVSDHGVFLDPATGYRVDNFNGILKQMGLLSYDAEGRIDFGNTTAFECNNNTFDWQRRICINLAGKFSYGVVPQNEFETKRNEVIEKLNTLTTRSGESIFLSVERSQKEEADIAYDLRRDLLEEEVLINGEYIAFRDYMNLTIESGHHYSDPVGPNGIFIWYGPGIKRGYEAKVVDLVDIYPNILHALGLPIPKDIDGAYLPEIFDSTQTPTYIDSYEEESNRIYSGSHELLDDEDNFTLESSELYIHSEIAGEDTFDQFCFDYPEELNFTLKALNFEQTQAVGLDYSPWNHPQIDQPVDLLREIAVAELPISDALVYEPQDITYQQNAQEEGLYRIDVPLDLQEPNSVGIWTEMSFYVKSPAAGTMRLIGRGIPAGEEYPIIEVIQGNRTLGQIEINSDEYAVFDFPIPDRGQVHLKFINDANIEDEDRNLYLQRIKFLPEGSSLNQGERGFFKENEQLCFFNKAPGTTEAHLQLLPLRGPSDIDADVEDTIIELLQNTGEIKEGSEVDGGQ